LHNNEVLEVQLHHQKLYIVLPHNIVEGILFLLAPNRYMLQLLTNFTATSSPVCVFEAIKVVNIQDQKKNSVIIVKY
jgi:hypothetical protein